MSSHLRDRTLVRYATRRRDGLIRGPRDIDEMPVFDAVLHSSVASWPEPTALAPNEEDDSLQGET